MRIAPLHRYKFVKNKFVYDWFSLRRVSILLTFTLCLIGWGIEANKDKLFPEQHFIQTAGPIKSKKNLPSKEQIAIQRYITKVNPNLSSSTIQEYSSYIIKYAKEYKVDPLLIAGLISVESKFDQYAISSVGALGLTQVLPRWHKDSIGQLKHKFGYFDLFNPEHSIALGTKIYAEYKHISKGNRDRALLMYNGSLTHDAPTYAKLVLNARNHLLAHVKKV